MPTSLPTVPVAQVADVPMIRFPPGTWLIIGWTVVTLTIALWASLNANTGMLDQFQLAATF